MAQRAVTGLLLAGVFILLLKLSVLPRRQPRETKIPYYGIQCPLSIGSDFCIISTLGSLCPLGIL